MDLVKLISVLFVIFVSGDAGGHGEKHHDHVKLHVPEFIHHDHHTKVITVHHHHHKPKKEQHHHHHHHHPKPHIPHGHHYHHHHKKTSTHSTSKGHSSHHGQHGHHKHHGHHGHHGHHEHKHHDPPSISYNTPVSYDPPAISYSPPEVNYNPGSSFESDFDSFVPSVSSIPRPPHVHGVVHTVKQVKVFDSLPGALPGSTGSTRNSGSDGYEVTEQGEEGEDDVFTAVNALSQTYPGTYGYVRNAAPEPNHDPFQEISQQGSAQLPNHDPFATVAQPTSYANIEGASGPADAFGGLPDQRNVITSIQPSEFSSNVPGATGFDNEVENIIVGSVSGPALLSGSEGFNDESPVSFSREAGIQQTVKTGGLESVVY